MTEMPPNLQAWPVQKIDLCVLPGIKIDDYLSKTAQQQRNRYDSNEIIEYLDSENLFQINFATQSSLDIGIVAY